MLNKIIQPIRRNLDAVVSVPGSKSITNRALLIASLASGSCSLENALFSDDSIYFANALKELGFFVNLDIESKKIIIQGCNGIIPSGQAELFIGNAGTAARFLSAFLTLGHGEYSLDGDQRMRERPINDLVISLRQLGAEIESAISSKMIVSENIFPPIRFHSKGLAGGRTEISGNISSQFLSAMLMTAPYAKDSIEIFVTTDLNSKPYVDMTLSMMKEFGVDVYRDGYQYFKISPGKYQQKDKFIIESDASAASYFFASAAIVGGTVKVKNISRESIQGDIKFLDVLNRMGALVQDQTDGISVTFDTQRILNGISIDMSDIPDTAQTLAVLAPFASSPTHISGIASARVKESDRISATCNELRKLGIKVGENQDGMVVYPCSELKPAVINTYNDHRMAMAFSLIGLRFDGVTIENPGCVSKTFPNYFDVLETL